MDNAILPCGKTSTGLNYTAWGKTLLVSSTSCEESTALDRSSGINKESSMNPNYQISWGRRLKI